MSYPIKSILNPNTQLLLGIDDGFTESGIPYDTPRMDLSYFATGQHRTTVTVHLDREAATALRDMADDLEAAWDRHDAQHSGGAA